MYLHYFFIETDVRPRPGVAGPTDVGFSDLEITDMLQQVLLLQKYH